MTSITKVATCVVAVLASAFMAGGAAAQTYRWVSATRPPEGAVRAPDGERRFLCTGVAQRPGFGPDAIARFIGDYRDDGCHADDGGNFLATTRDLQFLAVVSGPDGGQWEPCKIIRPWAACYMPPNYARYRGWASDNQAICAVNGVSGWSYVAASDGSSEHELASCDITGSPNGQSPKILVGAFN